MECVILIGLPACGKTSFVRERFAATHTHVSGDRSRGSRQPRRRQEQLVAASLAAGRSVVVDNTNATPEARAPFVALARAHGARVVGCVFECEVADALRRNRLREGRARVPDVAVHTIHRRLVPPSWAEGFDRLCTVRLREDEGRFDVDEWPRG